PGSFARTAGASSANTSSNSASLPGCTRSVAITPMSLMSVSLDSRTKIRIRLPTFFDLDSEAVQDHRHLGILAHGENEVHPPLLAERGERSPALVAHEMIAGQLVSGAEHRAIEVAPALSLGAGLDALDLDFGQPAAKSDPLVLRPLVA